MIRQLLLTLAALVILIAFFLLPQNRTWFTTKILVYWSSFKKQKDKLDTEHRKTIRWGTDYTYSKKIADHFERNNSKDSVLVLLPPTNYFKAYGINYHVPEPAVFYYYTGLKTVWANSKEAVKANWYIRAKEGNIVIERPFNKQQLQDSILAFKKFGVSL